MIKIINQKDEELEKFQLLLQGPEKEDIDFGETMAPNSKMIKRKNELGVFLGKKDLSKKHNTKVLHNKDLKAELSKYFLTKVKMLHYQGDFDVSYLKNVREFIKEHDLKINDYDLKNELYAIYPNISVLKKPDYIRDDQSDYKYVGENVKNPTVVYREGSYYHVVHQGNNYKTIGNLFYGLLYSKKATKYRIFFFLIQAFLIFFGTTKLSLNLIKFTGWCDPCVSPIFYVFLPLILIVISAVYYFRPLVFRYGSDRKYKEQFSL